MDKTDFDFNSIYGRYFYDELDKRYLIILSSSILFVFILTSSLRFINSDYDNSDYFLNYTRKYSNVRLNINEVTADDPVAKSPSSEYSSSSEIFVERIDPRVKTDKNILRDKLLRESESVGVLAVLSADGADYSGLPELSVDENLSISDVLAERTQSMALIDAQLNQRPGYANSSKDVFIDPQFDPLDYDLQRLGNPYLRPTSEMLMEEEKQGYRDPNEIAQVIKRRESMVEYCHRKEQKMSGEIEGAILVQFKIMFSGEIAPGSVRILKSTLYNKRLEMCIKNTLRRWRGFERLDESNGNVTVIQKFIFN